MSFDLQRHRKERLYQSLRSPGSPPAAAADLSQYRLGLTRGLSFGLLHSQSFRVQRRSGSFWLAAFRGVSTRQKTEAQAARHPQAFEGSEPGTFGKSVTTRPQPLEISHSRVFVKP